MRKKDIVNEKDKCAVCGKNVIKEGIQCAICDKWNHSKCAGITSEAYHEVQKELDKVTREINDIQKEIRKVLQNADTQISTSIKKQESKWSEVVTKQVNSELQIRSSEVENMHKGLAEAKEQYDDKQDKEKRRNNIILYRAQGSIAATVEERHKEDEKFCLRLFHSINSGVNSVNKEDVVKIIRLGKRGDEASQHPRPMLVQLASRLPKNYGMFEWFFTAHQRNMAISA